MDVNFELAGYKVDLQPIHLSEDFHLDESIPDCQSVFISETHNTHCD